MNNKLTVSAWQTVPRWKTVATSFLLFAMLLTPLSAFATETTMGTAVHSAELSGTLDPANNRHYFGLDANERDSTITLSLVFGPQNEGRIANRVNFWVLTESALKSTFTGTVRYSAVALAAGSAISGKNDDYKVQATFKTSGRDHYTVIVENRAGIPANYTLAATGGMLSDGSGQATTPSTPQTTESVVVQKSDAATTMQAAETMDSTQIAASIGGQGQHYYTIVPADNDEDVSLVFDYDPKGIDALDGKLNFFVFDPNGLRRLESGERPESVNLAAGNLVKSGESKRSAQFRAVGKQSYVVLVLNRSNLSATFSLGVKGGNFQ